MDRDSNLDADQGVRIVRAQRVQRRGKAEHDAQKKQSTTNARTHKTDTETETISAVLPSTSNLGSNINTRAGTPGTQDDQSLDSLATSVANADSGKRTY